MYSRYSNNAPRPIRLPDHYSGSAFSQTQLPTEPIPVSKREPDRPFVRDSIGEKVSPVADRLLRAEAQTEKEFDLPEPLSPLAKLEEIAEEEQENEEISTPPSEKKPSAPPFHFDGLRRLLSGEGGDGDQDRLLILGLILLLSRTEGDSDILLWLSLLLLCG